jgi:hypothetical protein
MHGQMIKKDKSELLLETVQLILALSYIKLIESVGRETTNIHGDGYMAIK